MKKLRGEGKVDKAPAKVHAEDNQEAMSSNTVVKSGRLALSNTQTRKGTRQTNETRRAPFNDCTAQLRNYSNQARLTKEN